MLYVSLVLQRPNLIEFPLLNFRAAIPKGYYDIQDHIAYVPLSAYPEAASDDATLAAIRFAGALGYKATVATFAVDAPQMASAFGGFLINVEGMARAAEDRSRAEC